MLSQFENTHHHETCRQQRNVQTPDWWLRWNAQDEKRSYETHKKQLSISALYLILSRFPLVLYRFSEPVVRVERKNTIKTEKLCGYFFQARSKLHRIFKHTVGTKRLRKFRYVFRFPVNIWWHLSWICSACHIFRDLQDYLSVMHWVRDGWKIHEIPDPPNGLLSQFDFEVRSILKNLEKKRKSILMCIF